MNKMNILQVINVRFYNATAWYALFLSKTLCEMGHNSTVITLEGTLSDNKAIEMGIPRVAIPYNQKKLTNLPKIYAFLEKEIQRLKPDIVNCHRGELFPLFILLKKKYGFKLVRTRGDQRPIKKNIFNKIFYANQSDAVIGTNSRIYNELINTLNVDKSKAFSILGGVDTCVFYPNTDNKLALREKYNYTSSDCVLGLLGRLDTVKGQIESILALAKAVNELGVKNVKLCIIGFDELYLKSSELYPIIEEHSLENYVQITGKVSNINDILNMCDIGWLSSVGSEAIARAAFEFMACDIPLISSEVGVMPDITLDEARFKTANIDDMAAFIEKISKAFDVKNTSQEAINARSLLENIKNYQRSLLPKLTLESFATKTLEVYTSTLHKN